jgi:hypothetical protein
VMSGRRTPTTVIPRTTSTATRTSATSWASKAVPSGLLRVRPRPGPWYHVVSPP